jgi:hypothetical protein
MNGNIAFLSLLHFNIGLFIKREREQDKVPAKQLYNSYF